MCSPTNENSALYYFEGAEALNEKLTAQIKFERLPYSKTRFKLKPFGDKTPGLSFTYLFELMDGEIQGLPPQLTTWQALHIIEASRHLLPDWQPMQSIISDVPEALEFVNDIAAQQTDDPRQMQKVVLLQACLNRLQLFYTQLLFKSIL